MEAEADEAGLPQSTPSCLGEIPKVASSLDSWKSINPDGTCKGSDTSCGTGRVISRFSLFSFLFSFFSSLLSSLRPGQEGDSGGSGPSALGGGARPAEP